MKPHALRRCVFGIMLAAAFFCQTRVWAQTLTPRTVTINANCKGFYEYLPVNYASAAGKFPLLLYCGGAGTLGSGTSAQLAKLLVEGPPYYIKNNQFPNTTTVNGQSFSFIMIAPQFINWPSPADVEDMLNYLIAQNYKIDQSRIYLTGYSAGGNAAWKYPNSSLSRSNRLAAVVPVAGYNYPYVDTGAKYMAAANLPVWALHSNDDSPAPVAWSQNFVNKINSYNPAVRAKITRFNGVTHDNTNLYVYKPTYRVDGYNIYEWMLLYSRDLPPVAKAGADVSITMPVTSATLNGSGSYDPEQSAITYKWQKISGPSRFTLSSANAALTTASNLVSGTYAFELVVTDINSRSSRDTVQVSVINNSPNVLPKAAAGKDTAIALPANTAVLNGAASTDGDGVIEKWTWSKIAGPSQFTLTNASANQATVSNLVKGIYRFRLVVTDNDNATASDTMQVSVINPFPNKAPVANAGSDTSITLPANAALLNGDASADSDGSIVQYQWKQLSGPSTATVTNANTAIAQVANLVQGTYQFEITVQDDSSATAKDVMLLTVLPAPAVTSKTVKINLYGGSNAYTTDGWNNWNITGETNITSGKFNYSNGQASNATALLSYSQGVIDNGASYGGTMCPPQVLRYGSYSTASTRTLVLRGLNNAATYAIELFASRSNTGNTTVFVINGTSKSVMTDNNKTTSVKFTNLSPVSGQITIAINKQGTFTYINGLVVTEQVAVAASVNTAPVANAGADQTVQLPQNEVQLNGTASLDANGTIAAYSWRIASGSGSYSIATPGSAITAVNNLAAGVYHFELSVTDDSGLTALDTVQVTVQAATPPAGNDSLNCGAAFKIIVLGSSTAYGTGASPIDSSWVNKYLAYVQSKNPQHAVINLGISSATTYHVLCPTGFTPPAGRPAPDALHNITQALALNPDAIIINLPSNDIAQGYSQQESKDNYERALALADAAGVPVWVTTTQPRSNLNTTEKDALMQFRDWTYSRFGNKTIDFWTTVADASGNIEAAYNAGDNVHFNNAGHQIFYSRAAGARILDSLCLRTSGQPVAKAGADVTLTLPQASTTLSGTASFDANGTIESFGWRQVAGPATALLATPKAATTLASGLQEGVYQFVLTVQDDGGNAAADTVVVTVLPAASASEKWIKINLYGGANPYNADGWNNWNVTGETNIVSGKFNYSNGQASTVGAVLNYSQGVPDNGVAYGGTMCPPQVLRYTSYSTASSRTLTLNGLSNTSSYDLELFASRSNTGNKTIFIVSGISQSVVTDNNKTASIKFTGVKPTNGQIIIYINKEGTFTYINGLIVTEKAQSSARTSVAAIGGIGQNEESAATTSAGALQIFPNPAWGTAQLMLRNAAPGTAIITITGADGKTVQQLHVTPSGDVLNKTLNLTKLKAGLYFVQVHTNGKAYLQKLYKQ